ncbi:4'-phosphopantetheinyl transferase [Rhizobium sp. NLR17b]|uniref:restriction endonuclease subunit S n=1 Tax=Rhizobium sp. NLR17b TaxID=2731114 RepID=UPI001C83CF86|nr:restriction endonuclease subunit S [Rhizobium sp. NLR17b]MBX5272998.1 4'-phosphopantetheinyl transferase [Rhizobium sp. NLR17b]
MSAQISSMLIRGKAGLAVNKPVEPVPPGWAWVAVNSIARQETGHTPSRSHPEWWGGDIPWIGIRDARLHHGGVIYETLQTTNPLGLANSSARLLPKGTVCLSRTASVGYVTIMGRDMATSQDFVTWTCSEALIPEFLVKALIAEGEGLRKFGKGTTHTTIYFPEIRALHICLPPLAEQKRIVAKLDALNAKSARARTELARIETLVSRYKQAVLSEAFSGELTRGQVSNWSSCILGDLALDVRYGTAEKCTYAPELTPVLRIPNVANGRIDLSDLKHASFNEKELMKLALVEGDLLVIRSNGSIDLVGRSAVVDSAAAGMLFAGYLIRIRLDLTKALPPFIQYWMQSLAVRRTIEDAAKSTSGVNNINSQQLQALQLQLPALEEQQEIVRRIESAFAKIDRLAGEAKRALGLVGRLDEAILAKAFRGELVPQDDNDEPAEKLLERIRSQRQATPRAGRGRGKV